MRRFGLPELLGIITSLVCFAWWSPTSDYLAGPKLVILFGGGVALLPAAIYRWRSGRRPDRFGLVLLGLAVALPVWSIVSWLGSGAPFAGSLFGWWGRSNGILSLMGGAALLFAGSTIARSEFPRVITWLLVGGTAIGVIGIAQLAGNQVVGGLPDASLIATMGNINFSAAYFAMIFVLAVGRAIDSTSSTPLRAWAGALAVLMAFLIYRNGSEQGPAAAVGGLVAAGVLWSLSYRGERRPLALAASGAVVALGLVVTVASFVGVGPLAGLWQNANFVVRQGTWLTAWNILQALPVFGTGPDGLQRYANEYSPEFYVEIVGTRTTLSAAHNVPLQYGATLGWLGLILWVALMVGVGIALLIRAVRSREALPVAVVAVAGAFTAYVVQAQVSIDMGGLIAIGWLLTGLSIAAACGSDASDPDAPPAPEESRELVTAGAPPRKGGEPARGGTGTAKRGPKPKSGKKRNGSSPSRAPGRSPRKPLIGVPAWVPASGAALGVAGVALAMVPVVVDSRTVGEIPQDQLVSMLESPWTSCAARIPLVQVAVRDLPPEVSVPATYAATEVDPRCDTITNFQAELAVQNQQADIAAEATLEAITYNPDNNISWILRSRYHLLVGDLAAAEADYSTAAALTEQFPGNEQGLESLQRLRADLDAATAAPAG